MSVFPANLPSRDPPPHERCYFRNSVSGNLGWLVKRNGKDAIRLDRLDECIVPMGPDWKPEVQKLSLTDFQIAQVAYEADRKLGFFSGRQRPKDWSMLPEDERLKFAEDGPSGELRQKLFRAIHEVLRAPADSEEHKQPADG